MHDCRPVVENNLCYIPELSRKLPKNKDAFEHMIYMDIGHTKWPRSSDLPVAISTSSTDAVVSKYYFPH